MGLRKRIFMNNMNNNLLLIGGILLLLSLIFIPNELFAQCPMCSMSAEADLKNGGSTGKGLNAGIMYMISFPYLMLGIIAVLWYRNQTRVERYEQARELRALLEPLGE